MKLKKILSSVVAIAMAVTTLTAFSTSANAAAVELKSGGAHTFAEAPWAAGTANCTFTTLTPAELEAYGPETEITIEVVPGAGADTSDWKVGVIEEIGESNYANCGEGTATSCTVTVADLLAGASLDSFAGASGQYQIQVMNVNIDETIDSWSISVEAAGPAPVVSALGYTTVAKDTVITGAYADNPYEPGAIVVNTTINFDAPISVADLTKIELIYDIADNHNAQGVMLQLFNSDWSFSPSQGNWSPAAGENQKLAVSFGSGDAAQDIYGAQITVKGNGVAGDECTGITIKAINVYSKNAVEAGTKYSQKSAVDNGVFAARGLMMISEDEAATYDAVNFTFERNDGKTAVVTSNKCYKTVTAAGETYTAPNGYVFVACAIKNIPEAQNAFACADIDFE